MPNEGEIRHMPVKRGRHSADIATASLILRGQAQLTAHGRAPLALERKDAGLLAYLALEGPTQRAPLAALLWPTVDENKARTNLRQRLARLRKVAGNVVTDRQGVLALAEFISIGTSDAARTDAAFEQDAELLGTQDLDGLSRVRRVARGAACRAPNGDADRVDR